MTSTINLQGSSSRQRGRRMLEEPLLDHMTRPDPRDIDHQQRYISKTTAHVALALFDAV